MSFLSSTTIHYLQSLIKLQVSCHDFDQNSITLYHWSCYLSVSQIILTNDGIQLVNNRLINWTNKTNFKIKGIWIKAIINNYRSSIVAEMDDRLATTDMGRKVGGCSVPFCGEDLGPYLTHCLLGQGLSLYQLLPSGILIHPAIWPQKNTDQKLVAVQLVFFLGGSWVPI